MLTAGTEMATRLSARGGVHLLKPTGGAACQLPEPARHLSGRSHLAADGARIDRRQSGR